MDLRTGEAPFRAPLWPYALVRSRRGLDQKDVEVLVLRHQLEVLRRQVRTTRDAAAFTAVIHRPRPAKPVAVMNSKSRLPPLSKKIPCRPPTPVRNRLRRTTASE